MGPTSGDVEPITVLVIDDQESFRAVAAEMMHADEEFTLFGTAADWEEGRRAVVAGGARPDLVLVDVRLGDESGIEVAARIHAIDPEIGVVLISTMDSDELPPEADTCGAIAFLPKMKLTTRALRQLWDKHRPTVSR